MPPLPVAVDTNRHQSVIVLSTVLLQEQTEMEERPLQDLPVTQQKRDEQTSDPAVLFRLALAKPDLQSPAQTSP